MTARFVSPQGETRGHRPRLQSLFFAQFFQMCDDGSFRQPESRRRDIGINLLHNGAGIVMSSLPGRENSALSIHSLVEVLLDLRLGVRHARAMGGTKRT